MGRARKEAACSSDSASAASEQELLQQYSSIKQLIGAKSFDQALSQGWILLEGVKAAYVAKSSSRCLQELFAASSLNVVICMAEAPDLTALPQLNAAVRGIYLDLRCVGSQTGRNLLGLWHMLLQHHSQLTQPTHLCAGIKQSQLLLQQPCDKQSRCQNVSSR
jgi:hypothetical protein